MIFKDKATFRISRDSEGNCTVATRVHSWFIFPHWLFIHNDPMPFSECLCCIMSWCFNKKVNNAIILDPDGANKKMIINYKIFKKEHFRKIRR